MLANECSPAIAFVAWLLGLICIVAFLFLIDYAARLLRPVSLVRRVGEYGLAVMESVYPERSAEVQRVARSKQSPWPPERTIFHRGKSAIVVAVNVEALFVEAEKAKGVIEFVPQVGDFVGSGEPLFILRGGAHAIDERKLRASVVLGDERTMDQDPLFAFRILADIAIRFYGAENMQIARRLRAMIVNLTETLPAQRHTALAKELELLDRAIERLYALPEDLKLARIPDSQGLGESPHSQELS